MAVCRWEPTHTQNKHQEQDTRHFDVWVLVDKQLSLEAGMSTPVGLGRDMRGTPGSLKQKWGPVGCLQQEHCSLRLCEQESVWETAEEENMPQGEI